MCLPIVSENAAEHAPSDGLPKIVSSCMMTICKQERGYWEIFTRCLFAESQSGRGWPVEEMSIKRQFPHSSGLSVRLF